MKKFKLDGSMLVKGNEDSSTLVLNLASGEIFRFEGEISTILQLLDENNKKELSDKQLKSMLIKKSIDFAKHKNQDKAILHGLNFLKKIGVIKICGSQL